MLSLPKGILANFLHIAEMMEECGPALGLPYTKSLGKGLFEIRVKGSEGIGRSFFCIRYKLQGNNIFLKKNSS